MSLVIYLLVNSIAVYIAGYILQGIKIDGFLTALIVAIVLGVINTFIKPILLLLALPFNILTLGLFTFVINGFLILLVSFLVKGFHVDNLLWAILFSIVISLVSSFLNMLLPK